MITKSKFKFFDKEIEVEPITVGQYVRVLNGDNTVLLEIFGKTGMLMCERQQENAFKILLGQYDENGLKTLLTSKKAPSSEGIEGKHFFIIEGKMMIAMKQSRTELRTWEYFYFMDMYKNLDVIVGDKTYDDFKNGHKPDKKGIKNLVDNK